MNDTSPAPAPKPVRKLLTEDRNSATRIDSEGVQKTVKVVDRAEEASRQGVSESSI